MGDWGGNFSALYIFEILFFKFLFNFQNYPPYPPLPPHYLFYDKIYIYKYTKSIRNGKRENGGGRWGGSRFCGGVGFGRLGEVFFATPLYNLGC
jgi:hypothetical protein